MPEEHGSESRDHIGTSHSHLVNLVRERLGVQYSTECPWYPVCREQLLQSETDGIGTDGRTTLRSSGHETDENESRAGCGSEQRRIERRSRISASHSAAARLVTATSAVPTSSSRGPVASGRKRLYTA